MYSDDILSLALTLKNLSLPLSLYLSTPLFFSCVDMYTCDNIIIYNLFTSFEFELCIDLVNIFYKNLKKLHFSNHILNIDWYH